MRPGVREQERFPNWRAFGSSLMSLKLKLDDNGRKDTQEFTSKHNESNQFYNRKITY